MDNPTSIFYFLLAIIGLAALLSIWVFWKSRTNRLAKFDQDFFQVRWQGVQILKDNAPPQAVVEADKLFDHALKSLGYQGSFIDKYKKAQTLNSNPQAIWDAHKLRNRISHEAEFNPSPADIRLAISAFRQGLRELGIQVD